MEIASNLEVDGGDDDETGEDGDAFDEHDVDGHVVEENDENDEQGSSF